MACLWGVIAFCALYNGVAHGSAVAWWLLAALVPPLIVFVWWMVDRSALERRIKRLEAQSEIGDERRVDAHTDLTEVEQKLQEIETRITQVEDNETGATRSGVRQPEQSSEHGSGSVAGIISVNPQ
jgi:type VI protein secretion system component VasK